MSLRSTAKRWTYLVHRWLGIGGCLLMLLWFISGMVMLFIGYPKLTPGERLAALPVLGDAGDWRGLSALPDAVQAEPEAVALTTVGGEAAYVVRSGSNVGAWSVRTGQALLPVSAQRAEASAAQFAGGQAFVGAMRVDEDRWTHSRALDAHRPLYRVEVGGAQPGDVYVSSHTGEVVLDAPRVQQHWNYVGAWLHWLYFLRMQSVDPVWTWVVIVLSALCTVAAISGIVVGVWRWRFRGHYRTGAKTPYVERWMRWHHLIGLVAAAFVFTWIFSGLMSMNPLGVFSSTREAIDSERYRGGAAAVDGMLGEPAALLAAAGARHFRPVEIQWRRLGGELFAVLLDGRGDTRIVSSEDGELQVLRQLPVDWLRQRARAMSDAPMQAFAVQHAADAYFYPRAPEAMNGAAVRRFPVAVADFGDAEATRVYLDLATGDPLLTMGHRERVGRWLFYFLHSWDLPAMLRFDSTRLAVLLLLSVAGTALCATAVVIGYRRLRMKLRPGRR
ncbi:PepSY-associated TM helix domain-containing protein [Stenotrophomonas maltophilia]|uniref:PepSY-associated TM helix domain-containing protein n=1 Tax=Stenotrophomonas maltophilia TaxID=40324 RepID=UPI0012B0EA4F|nr:PepSY-associated TM helix domain-containing protein [Stenotrophomonas maltophilia]ELC7364158.1 PepSY domain-containing protein [Stenotrophomonas maltophilia]ELC7367504.1 PepSY domain-containing protein [Stenotrophomonas maltophilia]MBA0249855.1 PepSY domain-containing protein [Stenotrophomonas maltophilia]MBA0318549.1 PepSY domain-containing protein [Stenotrophomonas maltophilia]MBH1631511.1 PepSY domain-containing protein [Stenotrophomonas maltophilia]